MSPSSARRPRATPYLPVPRTGDNGGLGALIFVLAQRRTREPGSSERPPLLYGCAGRAGRLLVAGHDTKRKGHARKVQGGRRGSYRREREGKRRERRVRSTGRASGALRTRSEWSRRRRGTVVVSPLRLPPSLVGNLPLGDTSILAPPHRVLPREALALLGILADEGLVNLDALEAQRGTGREARVSHFRPAKTTPLRVPRGSSGSSSSSSSTHRDRGPRAP
jgi:hypothetical protein